MKRRPIAVAIAVTIAGVPAALVASRSPSPVGAAAPSIRLAVLAPKAIGVGRSAAVSLRVPPAAHATAADLAVSGAYGTSVVHGRVSGGEATLTLPRALTVIAQRLVLRARAGTATGTAVVVVGPGPPAGHVTPLLGAKSIVTGGVQRAEIVVAPEDAFGNPVADGTPVVTLVRAPRGSVRRLDARVRDLVSSVWVTSGPRAGVASVSARAGAVRGELQTIEETAARPAGLPVLTPRAAMPADGRTIGRVSTGVLRDRHGNVLPDGTAVRLALSGALGAGVASAETMSGVATVVLRAPQRPGTVVVRAEVAGLVGRPATIRFAATVTRRFPVAARWTRAGLEIVVGPVGGSMGALVSDGTTVSADAAVASADARVQAATRDGRAVLRMRGSGSAAARVVVRVGGRAQRLSVAPRRGR